jgi:hypothetical protein
MWRFSSLVDSSLLSEHSLTVNKHIKALKTPRWRHLSSLPRISLVQWNRSSEQRTHISRCPMIVTGYLPRSLGFNTAHLYEA